MLINTKIKKNPPNGGLFNVCKISKLNFDLETE